MTKAKGKKTSKKNISAVPADGVAAAVAAAEAVKDGDFLERANAVAKLDAELAKLPNPELTPRECVENAAGLVEEAMNKLETGVYLLNDARDFWNSLPALQRHAVGKAIKDFVEKSNFALSSLKDELRIVLQMEKQVKASPVAQIPTDLPAITNTANDNVSLEELKKNRDQLGLVLGCVAQKEVPVFESEKFLAAAKLISGMVEQLNLQIVTREQKA